jgi:mRNA interferase MazF
MARYVPARGDIVWTNLNPARGREQKGKRPAVVMSAREYNKFGLIFLVPITSRQKGYPIEVPIFGEKIQGAALVSQLRAVDLFERKMELIEVCPEDAFLEIQGKIVTILTQE